MTRFIIGLLLGLLIGIGGTAAFLITAGGGDYLVVSSPRVRELEAALKNVEQDRQWLRSRLGEASESMAKLESRFESLAARFESLSGTVHRGAVTAEPSSDPETAKSPAADGAASAGRSGRPPSATPQPLPDEDVEPAPEGTPADDAPATDADVL